MVSVLSETPVIVDPLDLDRIGKSRGAVSVVFRTAERPRPDAAAVAPTDTVGKTHGQEEAR
jgi:hypothetical protein